VAAITYESTHDYAQTRRPYGSPPTALLDDDMPLLPDQQPRRVVLYICGCGFPGDRCIAPVISVSGGAVRWTDFRRCWDSGPDFDPPVLELEPLASEPMNIADLVFDHGQYVAEVQRVAAAREWESLRWRTAILLNEHLQPGHPWSVGEDWYPGWVEPDGNSPDRYPITLLDDDDRNGVVLCLTAGRGHARRANDRPLRCEVLCISTRKTERAELPPTQSTTMLSQEESKCRSRSSADTRSP
jgi:hypothetical protein